MDATNWICGLMAHNYDAVGFIPEPTVRYRYIAKNRYVLQHDEAGREIGYILHGLLRRGAPCIISQHCIDYDARRKRFGLMAFQEFYRRCEFVGVSSINLRVAQDLEAVQFWQACGFSIKSIVPGGKARGRVIVEMVMRPTLPIDG